MSSAQNVANVEVVDEFVVERNRLNVVQVVYRSILLIFLT